MKSYCAFFLCIVFQICGNSVTASEMDHNYTFYERLMANPSGFDGDRIRVVGVLGGFKMDSGGVMYMLFNSKDKFEAKVSGVGIRLYFDMSQIDSEPHFSSYLGRYVEVWGRFVGEDRDGDASIGLGAGIIEDIKKIQLAEHD